MLSWLTPTNMVIIHLIQCSHSRGNRKLETQGRHQQHGTPRTLPRIRETERYFCPFFHLPVVHLFIRLSIHIPKCRVWINEQCSPPHLQLKLSDPQPEAVNKPAVKYCSTVGLVPSMGRNIQGWIKANCEKKKEGYERYIDKECVGGALSGFWATVAKWRQGDQSEANLGTMPLGWQHAGIWSEQNSLQVLRRDKTRPEPSFKHTHWHS